MAYWSYAVTKTTDGSGAPLAVRQFTKSIPDSLGMLISRSKTSYLSTLSFSVASKESRAVSNHSTSDRSFRMSSRAVRERDSSSTIRTRITALLHVCTIQLRASQLGGLECRNFQSRGGKLVVLCGELEPSFIFVEVFQPSSCVAQPDATACPLPRSAHAVCNLNLQQ